MLARVWVIALNSYREAVRARILHGLLALSLATCGYSLVVGAYTAKNQLRVVSDLGAATVSLYSVIVAVVLGATSLYRELELKTLFPILARPLSRTEYLVGKYLGTLLVLLVFVGANSGIALLAIAVISGRSLALVLGLGLGSIVALGGVGFLLRRSITYLPAVWAAFVAVSGALLASGAPDDRRVLVGLGALTLCEVAIVVGVATLFSSFSSPFLTAVFTFGVFLVGRSADTLAGLPERVFGPTIHALGAGAARVFPNLMLYVPPRPLLTGEASGVALGPYMGSAALHALAWALLLLTAASFIFRRRDFI
ncbi:MAG TPA: ABC transporter permease subunit [Polyangiaceae bacterium]|nr:ABC transporter permease subunit [Polyangiaceae bacterium]